MEENEEGAADSGDQQYNASDRKRDGLPRSPQKADVIRGTQIEKEPQKRGWYSPYIFDLKFSTVTQFIFSIALIFVGFAQVRVYLKQAEIMRGQLEEMQIEHRP